MFYDHMGHIEQVNTNSYQRPPAVSCVLPLAPALNAIDEGVKRKKGTINISIMFSRYINPTETYSIWSISRLRRAPLAAELQITQEYISQ